MIKIQKEIIWHAKDKRRYKEMEGKIEETNEQMKITVVGFFPPYLLYLEIQPGGR